MNPTCRALTGVAAAFGWIAPSALILYLISNRDPFVLGGFMIVAIPTSILSSILSFIALRLQPPRAAKILSIVVLALNLPILLSIVVPLSIGAISVMRSG